MEPKRTPGQAEGTEEDVKNALEQDQQRRQAQAASAHRREQADMSREPGRTPGQAEGTEEQAEGSLRNQK